MTWSSPLAYPAPHSASRSSPRSPSNYAARNQGDRADANSHDRESGDSAISRMLSTPTTGEVIGPRRMSARRMLASKSPRLCSPMENTAGRPAEVTGWIYHLKCASLQHPPTHWTGKLVMRRCAKSSVMNTPPGRGRRTSCFKVRLIRRRLRMEAMGISSLEEGRA